MDGRGQDALRGPTRVKGTYVSEALDAVSGRQGQFLGPSGCNTGGSFFSRPPCGFAGACPQLAPASSRSKSNSAHWP